MNEVDQIFNFVEGLAKRAAEVAKIKAERARQNRVRAQNNPFTKARKRKAMLAYYERKRQEKEYDAYVDAVRATNRQQDQCTCHLGNPPCVFCTDTNYCVDCDIQTWDDECPRCGRVIK